MHSKLLSGVSVPGPSSVAKEVAAGRAMLAALLPFHKVLVSLCDLLHRFMVT